MTDGITGGKNSYFDNLNSDSLVGLRVGILTELSETTSFSSWTTNAADTETRELFLAAVAELEKCGVTVVEVSIPNLLDVYKRQIHGSVSSFVYLLCYCNNTQYRTVCQEVCKKNIRKLADIFLYSIIFRL